MECLPSDKMLLQSNTAEQNEQRHKAGLPTADTDFIRGDEKREREENQ